MNRKTLKKGFTMIELLIVIAVIGTLMAVVVVALNPLQRLAQARDTGRISTVTQLGRDLDAYAVNNAGLYVTENATWVTSLVTAGEITTVPSASGYSIAGITGCAVNVQPANGYCYDTSNGTTGGPVIAFARLEAQSNNSRCAAGTPEAYAVYSSADGRGGIVCRAAGTPPVPGAQTFLP